MRVRYSGINLDPRCSAGRTRVRCFGGRSMSPKSTARVITFDSDLGRSFGCWLRLSLPSRLACCPPMDIPQSPAPYQRTRCQPSDECGNPRPNMCAPDFLASYSVARLGAHISRRFSLRRLPLSGARPHCVHTHPASQPPYEKVCPDC